MVALGLEILIAHQHLTLLDRTLAGQGLDELALPVAGHARDADDLARAHREIETGDGFAALVVLDDETGDFEHLVVARRRDARGRGAHHRVADHHRRHFARRHLAHLAAADLAAAPQHADVVAEGLHFAELVGDHQRRDVAAMRHVLEQAEDLVGLARRQHGGRLVEDEEALVEIEQLEDFQLLLFARRQRGDRPVERRAERHTFEKRLQSLALALPVDDGRRIGAADDEILRAGQRRHQREMLIDHADAERLRVARIAHRDLAPVERERALVRRIEAHDAFDQRRLARPVLAQQRVERASRRLERDIVQRREGAETLGHAEGFERGPARGRRRELGKRRRVGHGEASG